MKKTIIVEISLLFVFAVLFALTVEYWKSVSTIVQIITNNESISQNFSEAYNEMLPRTLTYALFCTLGLLFDIFAIIFIAIKDLPLFQPIRDKLTARYQASRQARSEAKAEKAEADKQARIEKLENELNELKKD